MMSDQALGSLLAPVRLIVTHVPATRELGVASYHRREHLEGWGGSLLGSMREGLKGLGKQLCADTVPAVISVRVLPGV